MKRVHIGQKKCSLLLRATSSEARAITLYPIEQLQLQATDLRIRPQTLKLRSSEARKLVGASFATQLGS